MVKEGVDSTVRPKVKTYEFDGGRMFLDAWAADGKPMLSQRFQGWTRVLGVVSFTGAVCALVLSDWSSATNYREEHVFSSLQRGIFSWWHGFIEMDEADVAKAMTVHRPGKPRSASGPDSWFASQQARENFAKAAMHARTE